MTSLAGAMVVNTRARRQAGTLNELLSARGANPVSFPTIEIAPPEDAEPLRSAIAALHAGAFEWLLLTSVNAVHALAEVGLERSALTQTRVAAVGDQTAAVLREVFSVDASFVPSERSAVGLAAELSLEAGARVLLPASAIARPELAEGLRAAGALVTRVSAYRTTLGTGGDDLAPLLASGTAGAIAFASPSAVDGFLERIALLGFQHAAVLSVPAVCIGRTTADHAHERGFLTIATSVQQTAAGLVDALELMLASTRKGVVRCL